MKSKNWIKRIVYYQERKEYHLYTILIFALFVGSMRFLEEIMLARSTGYQDSLVNTCVFYFHMIWAYTAVVSFVGKVSWPKAANAVLIGVFLGIFPPLIDVFVSGIGGFHYRYLEGIPTVRQFLMFDPAHGFPVGEALVLWSTIFFTGYYVYLKRKRAMPAILGGCLAYLVNLNAGFIIPAVSASLSFRLFIPQTVCISIIQLLAAVLFYLILNPRLGRLLSARCLHCLPFVLLCFLGAGLLGHISPFTVLMALMVFFAGATTLVQNDFFDRAEDALSGRESRVEHRDVLFFNACLTALIVSFFIMRKSLVFLPLLLLFICSVIYNHDFYRAKKFFPGNYKIEGMWGFGSFLAGLFSVRPFEFTIEVLIYCFLVFGGWSLVSTFKDYKDIDADLAAGNQTGYIMLMKSGLSIGQAHRVVTGVTVACLFVPVVWLFFLKVPLMVSLLFPVITIPPFAAAFMKPPGKEAVRNFLLAVSFYLLTFLIILMIWRPDTYLPTGR